MNFPMRFGPQLLIRAGTAAIVLELVVGAGCSTGLPRWNWNGWSGWIAGYESAERASKESGKEMLVFYRTTDVGEFDTMNDALQSSTVKTRTANYVRCCLFQSYEPDRRYVAQYGVERAPALILVHSDGTFHAQSGPQSAEQIARFVDEARPPGASPVLNPYVPRSAVYTWHDSLPSAEQVASRTGQSVLIVLDRWMSRDWLKLGPMLESREVHSRFADWVHCRPNGSLWGGVGAAQRRFGVVNLPAIVLAHPDGSYQVLELPTSTESIALFADAARTTQGSSQPLDSSVGLPARGSNSD